MPAALDAKEKEEIVDRLFGVFRDRGYEGASLADLSRATGLGRSSLYHHFPKGKEQMVEAVLARAKAFIEEDIAKVATSGEPFRPRVRKIIAALDKVYGGGQNPCLIGRLASSEIGPDARQTLREIFATWMDAITNLARESGMPPVRARHFAEDWMSQLQGALTLRAANGNCSPFERALSRLLELAKESRPSTKGA